MRALALQVHANAVELARRVINASTDRKAADWERLGESASEQDTALKVRAHAAGYVDCGR